MVAQLLNPPRAWYALSTVGVAEALRSDPALGLTDATAAERLAYYGPNIPLRDRSLLYSNCAAKWLDNLPFVLLILTAILVLSPDNSQRAMAILIPVIFLIVLYGALERWIRHTFLARRARTRADTIVVRSGRRMRIRAEDLVPGDLVCLQPGEIVPADLRLIDTACLMICQARLTGEPAHAEKTTPPLGKTDLPLECISNIAFQGTSVMRGYGRGLVIRTGVHTELRRRGVPDHVLDHQFAPLHRVTLAGEWPAAIAAVLCVLVWGIGWHRTGHFVPSLLIAASLSAWASPELLPLGTRARLAWAARNLWPTGTVFRSLRAVEALGAVTVICADLTTMERPLRAVAAWCGGEPISATALRATNSQQQRQLLRGLVACDHRVRGAYRRPVGDPIDCALWDLVTEAGGIVSAGTPVFHLPPDAGRPLTTCFLVEDAGYISFTRGPPDQVLPRCSGHDLLAQAARESGLNGQAIACRHWTTLPDRRGRDTIECDLTLIGIVVLEPAVRPKAAEVVEPCRRAGIDLMLLTDEAPDRVASLAMQLGTAQARDPVLTGQAIDHMDAAGLQARLASARVCAEMTPAAKARVVAALQARGKIVAFVSGAADDATSLARADVGVSLDEGGTAVARHAASLVMRDNDIVKLTTVIGVARSAGNSVDRFVRFFVASYTTTMLAVVLPPLLSMPMLLSPLEILSLSLLSLLLGLTVAARSASSRPHWTPPTDDRLISDVLGWSLAVGSGAAMVAVAAQAIGNCLANFHGEIVVLAILASSQIAMAVASYGSRHAPAEGGSQFHTLSLAWIVAPIGLLAVAAASPACQAWRSRMPLTLSEVVLCMVASCIVFLIAQAGMRLVHAKAEPPAQRPSADLV